MDWIGYVIAGLLVPAAIGAALVMRYKDNRKVKSISLAPWKVHVEFEESSNG